MLHDDERWRRDASSAPGRVDQPFCLAPEARQPIGILRERLRQHKNKEFWVSAIVFVSKDENLTKAHVRYLENRLLTCDAI